MSGQPGAFDAATGMYVEGARPIKLEHARFLRWLAERHWLEHEVAGPPSGMVVNLIAERERRGGGA